MAMSETQPIGSEQPPHDPAHQPSDDGIVETPLEQPTHQTVYAPVPERPRFRDRAFGLWTLVGVAVAGLLLGAVAATGAGALVHHDHRGPGQFGPGPGPRGFEGRGEDHGFRDGRGGIPPGAPGQVPPTTLPSDLPTPDDSDATPDTSTGSNT
jgi:hypothetical protein